MNEFGEVYEVQITDEELEELERTQNQDLDDYRTGWEYEFFTQFDE